MFSKLSLKAYTFTFVSIHNIYTTNLYRADGYQNIYHIGIPP